MSESWFNDFGELLETLSNITYNSDDKYEDKLKPHLLELIEIYKEVHEEKGYEDKSYLDLNAEDEVPPEEIPMEVTDF